MIIGKLPVYRLMLESRYSSYIALSEAIADTDNPASVRL